ncbi:uncharacterized protein AMSG_02786 [Thecamonas trahens ATCC 50062]|uniref:Uncharacterized protein n=1 Tax=Thecamonas trahens ATCC 50062 TaxID=461836 RepID=A0A0L0D1U9_THETB|nr:hypothetical protein AMSG_02786 [Thecamonas trahens ATCC 50062]KNC46334.1 hypothetical protein AMSG_02786 [Thecamonas trahens ATCC 50062]|eukprot:XP_013760627.1 hypothetical protein AMSG_02786 [Thecamonas trahens ATCC 50062]
MLLETTTENASFEWVAWSTDLSPNNPQRLRDGLATLSHLSPSLLLRSASSVTVRPTGGYLTPPRSASASMRSSPVTPSSPLVLTAEEARLVEDSKATPASDRKDVFTDSFVMFRTTPPANWTPPENASYSPSRAASASRLAHAGSPSAAKRLLFEIDEVEPETEASSSSRAPAAGEVDEWRTKHAQAEADIAALTARNRELARELARLRETASDAAALVATRTELDALVEARNEWRASAEAAKARADEASARASAAEADAETHAVNLGKVLEIQAKQLETIQSLEAELAAAKSFGRTVATRVAAAGVGGDDAEPLGHLVASLTSDPDALADFISSAITLQGAYANLQDYARSDCTGWTSVASYAVGLASGSAADVHVATPPTTPPRPARPLASATLPHRGFITPGAAGDDAARHASALEARSASLVALRGIQAALRERDGAVEALSAAAASDTTELAMERDTAVQLADELRGEARALRVRNDELQAALGDADERVEDSQAQCHELQTLVAELESRVAELMMRPTLEAYAAAEEAGATAGKLAEAARAEAQQARDAADDAASDARRRMEGMERTLVQLRAELDGAHESLDTLQAEHALCPEAKANLEVELERCSSSLTHSREQLAALEQAHKELEASHAAAMADALARGELDELVSALSTERDAAVASRVSAENEMARLQKVVDEQQAAHAQLEAASAAATAELRIQLESMDMALTAVRAVETSAVTSAYTDVREVLDKLARGLGSASKSDSALGEDQLSELDTKTGESEPGAQELTAALNLLHVGVGEAMTVLADKRSSLKSMMATLRASQTEHKQTMGDLERLTEAHTVLSGEYQVLEKKLSDMRVGMAEASKRGKALAAIADTSKAELVVVTAERDAALDAIAALEAEQTRVLSLEEQLAGIAEERDVVMAQLTELSATAVSREETVQSTQSELQTLQTQVTELRAELAEAEAQVAEVESMIEERDVAVAKLAEAEAQVAEVESLIEERDVAVAKLAEAEAQVTEVESLIEERDVAVAKLAEAEAQVAEVESLIEERDAAVAKLAEAEAQVAEVESLIEERDVAVAKLAEAEAQVAEVESLIEERDVAVAKLAEAEAQVTEVETLIEERDVAVAKLAEAEAQVAEVESLIEERDAAVAKLAEAEAQVAKVESLIIERDTVVAKLAEEEARTAELHAEIDVLGAQNDALSTELAAKTADVNALVADLESAVADSSAARISVAEMEVVRSQLEVTRAARDELADKVAELEEVTATVTAAESLAAELDAATRTRDELAAQLADVQAELDATSQQLSTVQAERDIAQSHLEMVQDDQSVADARAQETQELLATLANSLDEARFNLLDTLADADGDCAAEQVDAERSPSEGDAVQALAALLQVIGSLSSRVSTAEHAGSAELCARIDELEDQLAAAIAERDAIQSSVAHLAHWLNDDASVGQAGPPGGVGLPAGTGPWHPLDLEAEAELEAFSAAVRGLVAELDVAKSPSEAGSGSGPGFEPTYSFTLLNSLVFSAERRAGSPLPVVTLRDDSPVAGLVSAARDLHGAVLTLIKEMVATYGEVVALSDKDAMIDRLAEDHLVVMEARKADELNTSHTRLVSLSQENAVLTARVADLEAERADAEASRSMRISSLMTNDTIVPAETASRLRKVLRTLTTKVTALGGAETALQLNRLYVDAEMDAASAVHDRALADSGSGDNAHDRWLESGVYELVLSFSSTLARLKERESFRSQQGLGSAASASPPAHLPILRASHMEALQAQNDKLQIELREARAAIAASTSDRSSTAARGETAWDAIRRLVNTIWLTDVNLKRHIIKVRQIAPVDKDRWEELSGPASRLYDEAASQTQITTMLETAECNREKLNMLIVALLDRAAYLKDKVHRMRASMAGYLVIVNELEAALELESERYINAESQRSQLAKLVAELAGGLEANASVSLLDISAEWPSPSKTPLAHVVLPTTRALDASFRSDSSGGSPNAHHADKLAFADGLASVEHTGNVHVVNADHELSAYLSSPSMTGESILLLQRSNYDAEKSWDELDLSSSSSSSLPVVSSPRKRPPLVSTAAPNENSPVYEARCSDSSMASLPVYGLIPSPSRVLDSPSPVRHTHPAMSSTRVMSPSQVGPLPTLVSPVVRHTSPHPDPLPDLTGDYYSVISSLSPSPTRRPRRR